MSQSCGHPVQASAAAKQGAPWQFNNLQCHLGAITLPLRAVSVIISGPNTFPVLVNHHRLCTSSPGAVSWILSPMLFHIRAIFTPGLYYLLIFQLWSLSSPALSLSLSRSLSLVYSWKLTTARLFFVSAQFWQDVEVYHQFGFCSSSIELRFFFMFHLHTHYNAPVTANNLFGLWILK